MNRETPEHWAILDVSISMTHSFDESFLRTEDSVNTDSKSHLSDSVVEDTIFSEEEFAMKYLIHEESHEKWIQIVDYYFVSAIGLKKDLKISNIDICTLSK